MDGEAGGEEVAVYADGDLVEAGGEVREGEVKGSRSVDGVEAFVDELAGGVEELDSGWGSDVVG